MVKTLTRALSPRQRPRIVTVVAVTVVAAGSIAIGGGAFPAQASVPKVTGDSRVDTLLTRMTLDEKLTLIEGQAEAVTPDKQYQAGYLPGIPRLGIPSLKLSDGPPGVITKQDSTGMTSTMGLAATFSPEDARANGVAIGSDGKALGQDVVLEPFVNLDRDTSFGRGFNTYGEDPLLSAQTGAALITGIQSTGEMAHQHLPRLRQLHHADSDPA